MVLDGAIKAATLIRFLERLIRDAGRKVFLILDRLPVHRSRQVRGWLDGRQDPMRSSTTQPTALISTRTRA